MEEFICERGKSVCYKDGNIFRKYHKYSNESTVIKEGLISLNMSKLGIPTPRYKGYDYSQEKQMFYSEYQYHEIIKIEKVSITVNLLNKCISIINNIQLENDKTYKWEDDYLPNICRIIQYMPKEAQNESKKILRELKGSTKRKYIHGDYSFENIGVDKKNNQLIVFDFHDSCLGIQNWDLAYLLSSIPYYISREFCKDKQTFKLLKLITAVKYARGLRKNFEIKERKSNYDYWWNTK